jgi:hypothetical protein
MSSRCPAAGTMGMRARDEEFSVDKGMSIDYVAHINDLIMKGLGAFGVIPALHEEMAPSARE